MQPQSGQARLVADAVPLVLETRDVACWRTRRKEERTIGVVSGDGVDDRARGARQPHRARPGLRIGQADALAANPVPFEGDDFAQSTPGQHQQPDDGDDMGTPELVAGQHRAEAGHLFRRQEPLPGRHPVAPGVLAGVGVVGAVSPQLGHAHHGGQDRHGAVCAAGPAGQGRMPIPDVLDGDGVHGMWLKAGRMWLRMALALVATVRGFQCRA